MTLRARLIVAFLALSVVPLGVVTFYTYTTSVEAMRNVAANEADLLAAVLNQRMQVITSDLSDRIAHLIDMTAPLEPAVVPAQARPAAPAPAPDGASTMAAAQDQMSHKVADALGEAAVLLNTVNVQGLGRNGQTRPPGSVPSARAGGQGAGASVGQEGLAGRRRDLSPPPADGVTAPTVPPTARPPRPPQSATDGARGPTTNSRQAGPPVADGMGNPGVPDPRVVVSTEDGMKIDLTQIRHEIYRQILPPSTSAGQLTPEERQRIAHEVNQRMLGIVEGIKLSAAELQKQADQARLKADTLSKDAAKTPSKAEGPAMSSAASEPAGPPPAPAVGSPAVTATTLAPLKRTATFSGNRLDVKFERNGQVVRTVNAEINLPNMLMTVFGSTPRETGEVPFAVDKDGRVYAQTDEDRKRVESFGAVATPTGPVGKTVLPDWVVVTTAGPAGSGLRFGIARSTGDSIAALRGTAGRNVGFGLLFIVIALAGVVPLSTRLTRNLTTLTDGVSRIAQGDYAARVSVRAHDEVGALATAFNRMAADVEQHQRLAVEQERIKRELELGRQIQHEMLPHGPLRLGLTEITGVSVPAREVGGDFFNYFALPSGEIAMLVGDVSGKGVGAALLMANIQASLRTRLALGQDLAAVAHAIDLDIADNAPEQLYATLFMGILDQGTRRLRYVNCGHHPQFVLRHQGGIERMASTGIPVGLLPGRGYRELDVQLAAGDRLFFYTDGCVEAENEAGDFFGADRLETALSGAASEPDAVLAQVERAVERFRGTRELLDDVTVMAVRVG